MSHISSQPSATDTSFPTSGPSTPDQPDTRTSAVLREFADYNQAQRLVDSLSDDKFPVEHLRIVGLGVRTEEQITGRMTKGRAALAGAAGGAWFGVLFGVLIGLFAPGAIWLTVILGSVAFAAFWGAAFGFVAHWATRGKRDFASIQTIKADRYAVMVDAQYYTEARNLAEKI